MKEIHRLFTVNNQHDMRQEHALASNHSIRIRLCECKSHFSSIWDCCVSAGKCMTTLLSQMAEALRVTKKRVAQFFLSMHKIWQNRRPSSSKWNDKWFTQLWLSVEICRRIYFINAGILMHGRIKNLLRLCLCKWLYMWEWLQFLARLCLWYQSLKYLNKWNVL